VKIMWDSAQCELVNGRAETVAFSMTQRGNDSEPENLKLRIQFRFLAAKSMAGIKLAKTIGSSDVLQKGRQL
jgi:hypothetical protein